MRLPRRACAGVVATALAFAFIRAAVACDFAHAPTTRWHAIGQDGRAWLVDPCGSRTFSIGVNVLDDGLSGARLDRPHYDWRAHYASLHDWIVATDARLRGWGFNAAGAWSLPPQELRLPTVVDLELGRLARFHWFDPFQPDMAAIMDTAAVKLTAPYRHSAYRIGYFSDNEVGWWSGALFTFYSGKPAANYTKQRLVAMLRARYHDDWRRFARDFVPPAGVTSWPGLLATRRVTRLRPGGDGAAAIAEWTGIVARHYYALAAAAIRKADPGALYFGDRLPIYYDPAAIRAEAPYVDVIATNYNVDSPEGWIAPYFFDGLRRLSGDKPVLISEWFYAAHENRTGNRNNGHLMTVDTQAERAAGAAAAARNFSALPEILGIHWFQYYDYPVGGRQDAEDYNFGLVDIEDRPYARLVAALAAVDRELPSLHAAAAPAARQRRDAIRVPRAAIDIATPSLIDWPKLASLLPPLAAAPGDVPFGEVYLAWNTRGIALATIGQDYYDLGVLAYKGDFPLSEAYRVELDLDAGAGPRRFTLYFIPPKGKTRNYPPMKPLLCVGSPRAHEGAACPPVPGGRVHYFGADQPRIVADALIPWAALGMSGPPESHRIRLEVSAQSWFRARWMSLSGLPPEASAADPGVWATATLVQ
ncbi:MAG: hypothetical protein KGL11_03050 [Alphaproteobacteria bacterium]|nr:hypothetical protein [Alphaproteobacteria bacterium]